MGSLQVLKFEGNPISFPPKDAIQPQSGSPPHEGLTRETEVTEVAVTAMIKKFLRHYAMTGRMESDTTGDESSEGGADAPRFPLKRAASGRFPIKVNGADVPDMRSPNGTRPPPIPTRSHYRGLSQQSTAIRRPGVMPLTIGNVNERLRSNSETLLRSDRAPDGRSRRMGIVSKKASELGTLDETQANNRFSHYRGLSHGSAMQGAPPGVKSPATPSEPYLNRPIYVRRLSVLPERRRESKIFDPVIEAAKGILYSVFQIHPMIQMLMTLTSDGSAKRSSLEIVFYNTNSHVEELEQEIQRHDTTLLENDDEYSVLDNENVHRACHTLVSAYGHVCTLLADNIDTFVNNGDARYIRTLLMLLYNSIMEIRVTLANVRSSRPTSQSTNRSLPDTSETIKPFQREPFATPTADRTGILRNRNGAGVHNPANLRVATDIPVYYANGSTRTAKLTSATPRSGESFSLSGSRDLTNDYTGEDAQFDRVFLALQRSTDTVLRTLPSFHAQLQGGSRAAMQQRAPLVHVQDWKHLIAMCGYTIQQTEILRNRLSLIKLNDPNVRSHPGFWTLCNNFVDSWMSLIVKTKESFNILVLPPDTRMRLRPIQQCMKEFGNTIVQSPWQHLMRSSAPNGMGGNYSQSASPTSQVPITPQSAALGPAMQATVPTTPHSASFAAAFHGNVFDRADALMANPGISMSRSGTMSRGHSGFNSLSSISSMSSDGNSSVSTPFSPPNGGLGLSRPNGGRLAL